MEPFLLYSIIISAIAFLTLLWIFISVAVAYRKKAMLKPVQYLTYNRQHFDRDFEFTCEYCGKKVSTKATSCMQCGSSYGENKEYKSRKKATDLKYLEFLKLQEEQIKQETTYIEETMEALRKNRIMKKRFFNFELGEMPVYRPSTSFEFTCEYCSTKLDGRSTDEKACPNCGAVYSDNVGLLVAEEEEKLEKTHYQEYLTLKDIEWNQNIENVKDKKDAFYTKHARGIALLVIFFMFAIAFIILRLFF